MPSITFLAEAIISDQTVSPSAGRLFCLSVTHKTADVSLREKIHVRPADLAETLAGARSAIPTAEMVILSTCNRLEIYATEGEQAARSWLVSRAPELSGEIESRLVTQTERSAVRHLFSVASGLEAQILGETQIMGQVKDAYEAAHRAGLTGSLMNHLFQRALTVGKRVRTETHLAETPVSVSSVAVRLCEKIFGDLSGRLALIVGAGEISWLAAEHLAERGARLAIFSTRGRQNAEEMSRALSAPCYSFDEIKTHLPLADIAVSGSGAPHLLLTEAAVQSAQSARHGRPLFIVDLAVPRNIDPAISGLENVFLYNLDDLDGIAREHRAEREKEIPHCEQIILEEADAFMDRWDGARMEEPLRRFHAKISDVVSQELARAGVNSDQKASLIKSIPNRILSEAFKRSRGDIDESDRETMLKVLKEFFGL